MGSTSTPPTPPTKAAPRDLLAPDVLTEPGGTTAKTALYWLGVVQDPHPPMVNIGPIGGVTFHSFYTPQEGRDGEEMVRGRYHGQVLRLSANQIAAVRVALKRTLVRWRVREGRHAHGYPIVVETEDSIAEATKRYQLNDQQVNRLRAKMAGFRAEPGDEPLAKYVYCVKVAPDAPEGGTWRPAATCPRPVLETDIESP